MKKIAISGKRGIGKFALVDDEDFDQLNKYRWSFDSGGYAKRKLRDGNKSRVLMMHSVIIGEKYGMITDHIDGDRLNNQKSNLRLCNSLQNVWNRKPFKNRKCKYFGVRKDSTNTWRVEIRVSGKREHYFGFKSEEEAGLFYNKVALKTRGEFAKLNQIGV